MPRSRALPPIACADAGVLEGPFWDAFTEEAAAEAEVLGLAIKSCTFQNGKLTVLASGAGVDELQQLNSHLSGYIDTAADEALDAVPAFVLEVASPGLSSVLSTDRDFNSFKGFPVTVTTSEPVKSKTKWEGTLVGRDEESVTINLKGRAQKLPRALVIEVSLPNAKREPGDVFSM